MGSIIDSIHRLGILESEPPSSRVGEVLFGKLGEIFLPDELLEIYRTGDSIKFTSYPGQMIPFENAKSMLRATYDQSVYDVWPFFVANDYQSDELAVIVHGPGKGYVMQRCHDGFDRMIAPDVATFFRMLDSNPPSEDYFGDEEEVWIYPRELSEIDRNIANEFLANVTVAEDSYEGE
jgi:hypothetical protein